MHNISLLLLASALALACSGESGSPDPGPVGEQEEGPNDDGASGGDPAESNATPAPCASDDDCPGGVECVLSDDGGVGFCNVVETVDDSGQSAPDDSAGSGSEDVSEGPVEGAEASGSSAGSSDDGSVSIGTPAPCTSDADCPGQCVFFDEQSGPESGPGYCDVEETSEESQ